MTALALKLPPLPKPIAVGDKEILMVTSGDLRESANVACWPVQKKYEDRLDKVLKDKFGYTLKRAHAVKGGHGFIGSQREGSDVFAALDPDQPVIVLLTAGWAENTMVPAAAIAPTVAGLPKAAFSQTPQNRASMGSVTSPSAVIASRTGASGSRP